MVALVRCTDGTVSVALESRINALASEGLITAYLDPDGWVEVIRRKEFCKTCTAPGPKRRCTAFVSCF